MPVDGFKGEVKDFDFTIGSVVGVRGFKQDSLGRLIGVSHPKVFRPGTNVATCDGCKTKKLADCSCGYYAYFQQEEYGSKADNSFYGGAIGAIVRGHGRTVVGTKGFRAEKADLLGLFPIETVHDKKEKPAKPVRRSPFRFLYPSTEWFRKRDRKTDDINVSTVAENWGGFFFYSGLPLLLALIITPFISGELFRNILMGAAVYVPWALGFINRAFTSPGLRRGDSSTVSFFARKCRPGKQGGKTTAVAAQPVDPFEKLRILYPDTPVYPSFLAAIKAHPLTTPEEHQPPDPTPDNTDGFWDLELPENSEVDGWFTGKISNNTINASAGWFIP